MIYKFIIVASSIRSCAKKKAVVIHFHHQYKKKQNFRHSKCNTVEGYQTVNIIRAGRLYIKCI